MPSGTLPPALFAILSSLVEERSGLHYGLHASELFASKVAERAEEAGFASLLDYYYYLRYDSASSAELDALLEALVVNETYFFREAEQLRLLVESVLLPAIARGKRPRVWCAACATGEEPLTLAMMLADREVLDRVTIVASDISARALERARLGVYGARSLRALPSTADRWFTKDGDKVRVDRRLIEAIALRRVNLVQAGEVAALGTFDVILCRNVLIYFDDATITRVLETLSAALVSDGYLLIGVSESLFRFGTLFRCEERGGTFFYLKAA